MTPELFVQRIQSEVYQAAVDGVIQALEHPPGRSPRSDLVGDSKWYKDLSEIDREHVESIVARAASSAVFGFLCVLDHVRSIRGLNEPECNLQLRCIQSSESTLLNPPSGEFLHDIFNDLAPPS